MKIVTSGSRYIDIDAYAGIIAYSHLLNLKGIESKAVSGAKLNESITPSLLNLDVSLDKYEKSNSDEFIIIDVSDPDFFDKNVIKDKIIQIIDHHTGFENYWKEKLGDNSKIEFIGSVATIIFELYEKNNLQNKITKDIATLLMAAILDNTLNFKAKVTTTRDIIAYEKLKSINNISNNFEKEYFLECQKIIENNFEESLKNDTKIGVNVHNLPNVFSQLLVWDKTVVLKNRTKLYDILNTYNPNWILNLICLSDGKSYILTSNDNVKQNLLNFLDYEVLENNIIKCKNVWLRKEIIKCAESTLKKGGN